MNRLLLFGLCLFLVGSAACSPSEEETPRASLPEISIIEGMKYYVGGPIVREDEYGRQLFAGFNGEVIAPPSRGLVLGYRAGEDGTYEFRSWANGSPMVRTLGVVTNDGLLLPTRSEGFRRGVKLTAATYTYDDATRMRTIVVSDLDPETGEVVRTREKTMPYVDAAEEEAEDDDEAAGAGPGAAP